jgi:hypothetical protein
MGGKHAKTAEKIKSLNPAKPSQIVGIHQKAGKEHVEPAMRRALKAFESWRQSSFEERASLLFRVADLLRERKYEFMAWLVFEVSKNWLRPTTTSPRPSTSASSTRVKHCVSPRPSPSCSCPASAITSSTSRSAWAR